LQTVNTLRPKDKMSISGKNLGFVIDDYGNTGGVGTTRVLTKKDE